MENVTEYNKQVPMDTITSAPEILPQILRLVIALVSVLLLMGGLAMLLKRLGLSTNASIKTSDKRRLKIVESLPLDPRRRLAIIKCDDKEHLVILGQNSETVIDRDIESVDGSIKSKSST